MVGMGDSNDVDLAENRKKCPVCRAYFNRWEKLYFP